MNVWYGWNSGRTFTDGEKAISGIPNGTTKEIKARLHIQVAISRLMRGTDNQIQMNPEANPDEMERWIGPQLVGESQCQLLSCVWLFATPWTVVHHTPLSMELSRQERRVAIPFSGVSSCPRDWTWVSCNAGRFFTIWATREAPQLVHKQYQIIEYHQSPVRCIICTREQLTEGMKDDRKVSQN